MPSGTVATAQRRSPIGARLLPSFVRCVRWLRPLRRLSLLIELPASAVQDRNLTGTVWARRSTACRADATASCSPAGISVQELFHGGNGIASNAHDFHTVVLIQLVSDRCSARNAWLCINHVTGFRKSVGTRMATLAFAGLLTAFVLICSGSLTPNLADCADREAVGWRV
jgi:hypothetical protein